MKFHDPLVKIFRRTGSGRQNHYFLHCMTLVQDTAIVANGTEVVPDLSSSHSRGDYDVIEVELNATLSNQPSLNAIHPVIHVVDLGLFPPGQSTKLLEVTFRVKGGSVPNGKSIVHLDDAEEEDEKPGGHDGNLAPRQHSNC